jgi:hypothetical protein
LGSFARGVETEASDTDFLVEFKEKPFDSYLNTKQFVETLFGRKADLDSKRPPPAAGQYSERGYSCGVTRTSTSKTSFEDVGGDVSAWDPRS